MISTTFVFIIGIFLLLCLAIIIVILLRRSSGEADSARMFDDMRREVEKIREEMKGSLERNLDFVQKQAGHSHRVITEVTEKLGKLEATNKEVIGFTEQLKQLQSVLSNPKQRGVLGEFYLETILKNVLPPSSYQMQYKFNDGEIVDAVIFLRDKVIPIDSKFSLENYNRIAVEDDASAREQLEKMFKQDLKKRIDETSKYVRPSEGTLDFAFMFIPAEGIYYDLLVNQIGVVKVNTRDLIDYAFNEKKVIIVSPNSFAAYLQTVLQGLKALQIEESAKEIRTRVGELGKHLSAYETYMQKLGNALGTSVNMYNTAYKELGKVDKDVMRITGSNAGVEVAQIERPKMDE